MNDPITKALDACKYINSQTRAFLEEVETIRAALQAPTQPQGDQEHRGQAGDFYAAMTRVIAIAKAYKADESPGGNYKGANESNRRAIEYAETLLQSPPQTGEFVLVPRIPTDEMLKAGRDYFNECQDNAGYQAMIKAAPEQLPEVAPDNNPVQEADSEVAPPTNNECKSRDGGQHTAPASVDLKELKDDAMKWLVSELREGRGASLCEFIDYLSAKGLIG